MHCTTDRISVVVISKDDPLGLVRTINSILAQTVQPFEIIIIAAGSSQSVKTNLECHQIIKFFCEAASGISSALNNGITKTTGEWINFLNGGDIYRENDVLSLISAKIDLINGDEIITAIAVDATTGNEIPRLNTFNKREFSLISHQASFFKKELFSKYGLYSKDFKCRMDYEWMLRISPEIGIEWINKRVVSFEGGGISSINPYMSTREEIMAEKLHKNRPLVIFKLIVLILPFRLLRQFFRGLFK
jgi:glycosyltransferase involved in cell wall biosynthesis